MYSVVKRDFGRSEWIEGTDLFLSGSGSIKGINGAGWIWPLMYERAFFRKYINVSDPGNSSAHFICDNAFDLFINGMEVCTGTKEYKGDISSFLTAGENRINIRAYQTADDSRFTSALCGVITADGKNIFTDRSWQTYMAADFWQNTERPDWQTFYTEEDMTQECHIHPACIKRSLYMRRAFEINGMVKKAVLYKTSEGTAYTYINGQPTDCDIFAQGINNKYQEYREYDVTGLLKNRKNVISVMLGSGPNISESHSCVRMRKNRFRCELEIEYDDGRSETVATDGKWKCSFSPLYDTDVQHGERYDARLEINGWNADDFDDSKWADVGVCEKKDEKPFVIASYEPVRITDRISPVSAKQVENGVLYDFGTNRAALIGLELGNTLPGQKIKTKVCERLDRDGNMIEGCYTPVFFNEDGTPAGMSPGCMRNINVYYCRGDVKEIYETRFAYTGFRYLLVEGLREGQTVKAVMNVVNNDMAKTGELHSSCPEIEKIYGATYRTWLSNVINGPTDCPTREKNYWTGDAQLFCSTACYLTDCDSLLSRWTDGGRKMCPNVYGWGDEIYVIPYTLYKFFGNVELLKARYGDILSFAAERMANLEDHLPEYFNSPFNDHLSPERKNVSPAFFAHSYYCYMLKTVGKIAAILGDKEKSEYFASEFVSACETFDSKYYDAENEKYEPAGQSGYVLPLAFGIVPESRRELMARRLNESVLSKGCIDTGYAGTRYIMQVLAENGFAGTAYKLLTKKDFPSWNYMLDGGLTSISETWTGIEDMSEGNSISMNHFTLGSVTGWMFECLLGISWEASAPGFGEVVLKPCIIKEIGSISGRLVTVNGVIAVGIRQNGQKTIYSFETAVPAAVICPDGTKKCYPSGKHELEF